MSEFHSVSIHNMQEIDFVSSYFCSIEGRYLKNNLHFKGDGAPKPLLVFERESHKFCCFLLIQGGNFRVFSSRA